MGLLLRRSSIVVPKVRLADRPKVAPKVAPETATMWSDEEEFPNPGIVIYGEPGCGKTFCAATAPDPYFIASEPEGLQTLKKHGMHVPFAVVRDINDVHRVVASLKGGEGARLGIRTVVVDTVSTLSDRLMMDAADKFARHFRDKKNREPMPEDEIKMWVPIFRAHETLFQEIASLGLIAVYVFHVEGQIDLAQGTQRRTISAWGKFRERIRAYVSTIFYMEARRTPSGTTRILHSENYGQFHAKNRLPNIGAEEEPDLTAILQRAGCI